MTYFDLLPYAFKRFSVLSAFRTGPETLLHYLRRNPLPPSEKPALFTMNIMPPLMTVWHHLARKSFGDNVDIVIFDCSGRLKKTDFPGARVQKFLNFYAATKSDEFLKHIAKKRETAWVCDDDMFILHSRCLDVIRKELAEPRTATLSFRPRTWWHFAIDGKDYEPSGSYCIAMNRKIVIDTEHLSLAPCDGNNHVSHIGKPLHRYDTFDKANEVLLKKGYRCAIVPEKEREELTTGFSGTSSAVMLLWYFKNAEQTLEYLRAPADKSWSGNTLFTVLSGLLAISNIVEMHQIITGKPYMLPSLPSRTELEAIRRQKEPLLRAEHTFKKVDDVSERLRKHL